MWKLIKSEFEYNKTEIIILFILPFIYVFLLNSELIWNKKIINVIYNMMTIVLIIKLLVERMSVNRDRFHLLLPVNLKQVSFARIFWLIVIFLYITAFFFVITGVPFRNTDYERLGSTGSISITFTFISIFLLVFELRNVFIYKSRSGRILKLSASVGIILFSLFLTTFWLPAIIKEFFQRDFAFILFLFALILMILTYFAFTKSKSYL